MSETVAAADHRRDLARVFLDQHAPGYGPLHTASSDASNRRYWRAAHPDGTTVIVMDSPPDREPIAPFIDVQTRLQRAGLPVPSIHASNFKDGFLLLEDLGRDTLFSWLPRADQEAQAAALADCRAQLIPMAGVNRKGLPAFDAPRLTAELQLFDQWYRAGHLGVDWSTAEQHRWQTLRDQITTRLAAMPPVFVQRDYHSRNLMRRGNEWVIIDFQDAVAGPLTYDLASLLRDSYIDWPADWVEREIDAFLEQAREAGLTNASRGAFVEDFAWVAVQRHLKVLGIFARLSRRDGKHGYLGDLPLTWRHLQWAIDRAPGLEPLRQLIAALEPEPAHD
ncbi:MAG TPA: phosphotransferase [Guyparkeria sp.]|nr:phosphotransferase [Guyparkeria sp.]